MPGPGLAELRRNYRAAYQEALRCNRQLANLIVRQVARDMRGRPDLAEQAEMLRKAIRNFQRLTRQ